MPKSVLIVEDEPAVRDLLAEIVKMQNCNLFTAIDGEQAMQILKNNEINLVLIDVGLPGEDGISLSNRIKSLDSKIQIVLMSAIDIKDIGIEQRLSSDIDFIQKPFDINTMVNKIRLKERAARKINKKFARHFASLHSL